MMNKELQRGVSQENIIAAEERKRCASKLHLTVVLFIIAILAVATGTLAWFTLNSYASVDNLEINIGTGAQLLVSTEDHGTDLDLYTKVITNDMINDYLAAYNTDLSKIELDPVTSSDAQKFYSKSGNERQPNNASYLEFPIWYIATKEMYVHLSSDETATGLDDGTKVSTTSTGVKEDVIRCTRVGFAEDTDSAIYEPNQGAAVAGQTTFDLTSPMTYTNENRIIHLNALEPKKLMVRIWIEGEDPECDNDVQSANLAVALCFSGTDENNEAIG